MATVNKTRKLVYVAVDFTTGLTDLVLAVRKPDGTPVTPAPTFTEQGDGVYIADYTPDAVGSWQEKVTSVTNGDNVVRAYDVVAFDADDVKAQTDSIETKIDVVDTKVDGVQSTANSIEGKVDSVETKIDALDAETKPGGYFA